MELSEFLLARIAEDEEVAQQAAAAPPGAHYSDVQQVGATWAVDGGMVVGADDLWEDEGADSLRMVDETALHVARWDPARVLAECEVKRRVVESRAAISLPSKEIHEEVAHQREYVWKLLALPYADHPDYQEEWKP